MLQNSLAQLEDRLGICFGIVLKPDYLAEIHAVIHKAKEHYGQA